MWDIGEFVFKHFAKLAPHLDQKRDKETVTYHLPCHLKNHGQMKEMVENLLKQLPHADYQKAEDWDSCCGGGGFFFNEYPEISKRIVDGKIKNAGLTQGRFSKIVHLHLVKDLGIFPVV